MEHVYSAMRCTAPHAALFPGSQSASKGKKGQSMSCSKWLLSDVMYDGMDCPSCHTFSRVAVCEYRETREQRKSLKKLKKIIESLLCDVTYSSSCLISQGSQSVSEREPNKAL